MTDTPERGQRVRLVRCTDYHTRINPGDEGTVLNVDSMGTIHVKWDSGSTLGLIQGEDQWTVLPECDCVASVMKRPIGHVPGCPAGAA
jgi:hypothetical protein